MPLSYRIDDGILWVSACGAPTLAEVEAFVARWSTDPDLPSPWLICRDGHGAAPLSPDDARSLARFVKTLVVPAGSRLAVVAASDLEFGLCRMFELHVVGVRFEIAVFRCVDEAAVWLRSAR